MFHNPEDCAEYGRHIEGPARARVFEISELLSLQRASREHCDGPTIRGWTYIILSCALFLRKAEASDLMMSDIEVPMEKTTGKPLLSNCVPKYLFVHIRRSKTDQDGRGKL